MGIYDLPSTMDYILNNTNRKNLSYVCFSQGCTQTFVMGSLKPEYNEKIKFAVALSPAVYMTHMRGVIQFISPFTYILNVRTFLIIIFIYFFFLNLRPCATLAESDFTDIFLSNNSCPLEINETSS